MYNIAMYDELKRSVYATIGQDRTGHGVDHVERVLHLTEKFAKQEQANLEMARLIALLHDVDDYKIYGQRAAAELPNARRFLSHTALSTADQDQILAEIQRIGYKKRLAGITPQTIEGKIVSDADMCDSMGAVSIVRACEFGFHKQRKFFRRDTFPSSSPLDQPAHNQRIATIHHFFDKVLRLKSMMLTKSGQEEAAARHDFTIDFLRNYFQNEDAPEWLQYLDDYLAKQNDNDR